MKLRSIFSIAALAMMTTPAFAADVFSVTVPYQFASLDPSVTAISIACRVRGYEPVTKKFMTFTSNKFTTVPVVKGAAGPGQVTIVFKTEDFTDNEQVILSAVTDAQCNFNLVTATGSYAPSDSATQPVMAHKAGTPLNTYSTGTFPK